MADIISIIRGALVVGSIAASPRRLSTLLLSLKFCNIFVVVVSTQSVKNDEVSMMMTQNCIRDALFRLREGIV